MRQLLDWCKTLRWPPTPGPRLHWPLGPTSARTAGPFSSAELYKARDWKSSENDIENWTGKVSSIESNCLATNSHVGRNLAGQLAEKTTLGSAKLLHVTAQQARDATFHPRRDRRTQLFLVINARIDVQRGLKLRCDI